MRKVKLNTELQYSQFLRWYFISLLIFLGIVISTLTSMFYYKSKAEAKLVEIEFLKSDLESINTDINFQIKDGSINIHDVFLDFGDFHDKIVHFVGLTDLGLLDSLSKVGSVARYFDLEAQQKHHLEVVHYLDLLDDLLLNSESQIITPDKNTNSVSKKELEFKTKWLQVTHLLNRSLLKAQHDFETKTDNYKRYIYLSCLFFIGVLLAYILVLFFLFNFRFLEGLKFISGNINLLAKGEAPRKNKQLLNGELYYIQKGLLNLHNDFSQTDKILELFYSEHRITDDEMELYRSNIFFKSINKLRKHLSLLEDNEKIRNWDLTGISQLTDITNKFSGDPKALYEHFLIALVKYIEGVQGGIFVKETENIMALEASYAYDRIKKKERVISIGEGLLGEVWAEKKIQYIENVPLDHFFVKSALGESKPVSLMILPIMDRGICYGVLEIAVFSKLPTHKQDFLNKASEILAAATANIKVNQKTKQLLRDSQILTERLKKQESDNIGKIEKLRSQIEKEQQTLFSKDRELKSLRLELDLAKATRQKLSKEINEQELIFKNEAENLVANSVETKKLEEEIQRLNVELTDLKETVHIRNLKIERLRKKLENDK